MASKIKTQLIVFIVFFLTAELVLRIIGFRAGTLIDDFITEDHPVYAPRFFSDEVGINYLDKKSEMLMLGTVVNKQGFRSNIDFTSRAIDSIRKNGNPEIVMVIGDSYVEGCRADTVTNSFPDLVNRDAKYEVLNFGISGTDPVQYDLIIKKYLKILKPDKVIVAIYFGNDFLTFERKPNPGILLHFPFKNNKWIFSTAPNHLSLKMNYVLKSPMEAYNFYLDHYTLRGKTRNIAEKIISYSVIISKIYLFIEHKIGTKKWANMNPDFHMDVDEITHTNLKNMLASCDSVKIPCLFVGIPSPGECEEGKALSTKYANYFKEIKYYVPENIVKEDYDGPGLANHFNNTGHRKYAEFLKKILETKKQ